MISTSDYSTLPDKTSLQKICKAISVVEAILSQEWQYRYYSYNSKWADNEEFFEMRDGSGDHMLILFREEGCVINGMAHEYHPKDKAKLTSGLPDLYNEFMFDEPVSSIGTTFCLWTIGNSNWQTGEIEDYEDGSEDLLAIFDGSPQTYIDWATDYYEDSFVINKDTLKVVSDIYNGVTLTKKMVLKLAASLEDWEQLETDLTEISYPFQFD